MVSPNNTSRWQMGFNLVFKGLNYSFIHNSSFNSLIDMYFVDHLNYLQKYFVAL